MHSNHTQQSCSNTTHHSSINVKDVAIGIKYTPWHSLHSCLLITTFAMPLTLWAYFADEVYDNPNPGQWGNAYGKCQQIVNESYRIISMTCVTLVGANNGVEEWRKQDSTWKDFAKNIGSRELRIMTKKSFPLNIKGDDISMTMLIGKQTNNAQRLGDGKPVTFDNANLSKGGSKEMRIDLADNSTIKNDGCIRR